MQQNEPPLEMPAQLEHLPVMAYVDEVDRDGRTTMVFLSGRHEEIIGYGLADFPAGGSEWDECIHPDDLAHYLEHFRGAWRDQEPLQVTYRFRRKDDAWIWIEERGMPAYDQARGLTVISGVVFDITAHHAEDVRLEATALGLRRDLDESQRDLAERVANYHSLFQTVDDMVLVCDMEGRVVESNPAAMHMTGYTAEELRGKSVIDLHPEEMREEAAGIIAAMLDGRASACALPLCSADGSVIPTETRVWHGSWDGEPCIFGVSRDLLAEREATERFDRMFHASPALMAVSRQGEGDRFVDVNDAWLRALGFTRDEVVGKSSTDLGLFPESEEQQALVRQLRETGKVRDARLQVRAKDGTLLDGVFSGELVQSQGSTYFLTVMVDETVRRRMESALLELNTSLEQRIDERTMQLEAANRELSGFVNSVAHDLRGPLRTIGSFAQILEFEHYAELSDGGRDAVRRIVRANGRMERLIEALLDLSGLTHRPLHIARIDLSQIARDVVADLHESDPDRKVDVVIQDGLNAAADPSLARILLENLLGNAWKFSSRREIAHIEVGRADADEARAYFVRDDGAGFDQRYANRLFRAFERLHDDTEFGGTGIGLATVQRITERHGGRAWAEGALGEGAAFFFTLSEEAATDD